MDDFNLGQIQELCYMVKRGKPCALMSLKRRYINLAGKICINEGLKFKTYSVDDVWDEFWIFKRVEMSKIIDELPKEPKSDLDHYLLGAIFGYSHDSICDFINEINQ